MITAHLSAVHIDTRHGRISVAGFGFRKGVQIEVRRFCDFANRFEPVWTGANPNFFEGIQWYIFYFKPGWNSLNSIVNPKKHPDMAIPEFDRRFWHKFVSREHFAPQLAYQWQRGACESVNTHTNTYDLMRKCNMNIMNQCQKSCKTCSGQYSTGIRSEKRGMMTFFSILTCPYTIQWL